MNACSVSLNIQLTQIVMDKSSSVMNTSLKTPEDQRIYFRFICPIHPYSAATIQAASYDETIVIQALGTLCLYTMHSN